MSSKRLTLGHSPDPDDAFMFYSLATGRIDTRGWRFEHVLQDIQTLNDRALRGELDITAISIHAYPYVAGSYALTNCGSSMGDGYGPLVVARQAMAVDDLRGKTIAVPGTMTTAFLTLNLLLGKSRKVEKSKSQNERGLDVSTFRRFDVSTFHHEVVMFDRILQHVAEGRADAGLIIHEGQLTYANHDLHKVVDLGEWWKRTTGLPLPLGGNCIRRDHGIEAMTEIAGILKESIEYSLAHRAQAVEHAMQYARDMNKDLADRFVGMYVNEWTVDYGELGRHAVGELLRRAHEAGLIPDPGRIDFIG